MNTRYISYLLTLLAVCLVSIAVLLSFIDHRLISRLSHVLAIVAALAIVPVLIASIRSPHKLDIYKSYDSRTKFDTLVGRWVPHNRVIALVLAYFRIVDVNYFSNDQLDVYRVDGDILRPSYSFYPLIELLPDRALAYFGTRPTDLYTNTAEVLVLPRVSFEPFAAYSRTLANIANNDDHIYAFSLHGKLVDRILEDARPASIRSAVAELSPGIEDFRVHDRVRTYAPATLAKQPINNTLSNILFRRNFGGADLDNILISVTDHGVVDMAPRARKANLLAGADEVAHNVPETHLAVYYINWLYMRLGRE